MSDTIEIKVGDELIMKHSGYGHNRGKETWVKVVRIGRKWLYTENGYRVDIKTLVVDGGSYTSPGKLWTEAALRNDQYRQIQWGIIREAIKDKWHAPEWMTNEHLDRIAALIDRNYAKAVDEAFATEGVA